MNQPVKKRGVLAGLGALVTAAALALSGAAAAQADPAQPAPETSNVVITKLAQPESLGEVADGTPWSDYTTTDLISGVTFNAYLVPGTEQGGQNDIGTNAGQLVAAQVTVEDAQAQTTGQDANFTDTTENGVITWNSVPRGLYLVVEDESTLPAGVTASAPFLLSVPLTDPSNLESWLDTIYVYPKNSRVAGTKTVENAEQLVVGDDITWTIATDIPRVANTAATGASDRFLAPDYFRLDDTLQDDELAYVGVEVTAGETALTAPTHYGVTPVASDPAGSTTYQILFTEAGRSALAAAVNANANAQVVVELTTTVLKADVIDNAASVYPDQNSETEENPLPIPATEVKYGSLGVQKASTSGDADVNLAGAEFRVYANETDALAANDNYLTPSTNLDGLWTTGANGQFVIEGLRFSEFADGAEQLEETEGSLYQAYYLVETKALDGHQLLAEPIKFEIDSTDGEITLTVTNQENTGGFVLPLTGGMGTALLTIAGIALLAVVLLVARRRRSHEASAE